MFLGTVESAPVHPREVVKRAPTLNAAAVIVADNHPNNFPPISNPRRADSPIRA